MRKKAYKTAVLILLVILCQYLNLHEPIKFKGKSHWHLYNTEDDNRSYYRLIYFFEDSIIHISGEFGSWGNIFRTKDNIITSYDSLSFGKFYKKGDNIYLTIREEDNYSKVTKSTYLAIKKDSCNLSEHYYSEFDLYIDLPISDKANEVKNSFKGLVDVMIILRIGYSKDKATRQNLDIYDFDEKIPFDSIKIKIEERLSSYHEESRRWMSNVAVEADKNTSMSLIDSLRKELSKLNIDNYQKFYFACINSKDSSIKYLPIYNASEKIDLSIAENLKGRNIPFIIFKLGRDKSIKYYKSKTYYADVVKQLKNDSVFTKIPLNELQQLLKDNLNADLVILIDYPPSLSFGDYIYFQTQIRIAVDAMRSEYALKTYRIVFEDINDKTKEEIYQLFPLQYIETRQINKQN